MSFFNHEQRLIRFGEFESKAPLYYPQVKVMGGIFTAPMAAIKEVLPPGPYRPLQVLPGVGLVGIHCMEYISSDIGPYNEVSLSVGLQCMKQSRIPTKKILLSILRDEYEAQIVDLPVTTEIALQGGLVVFNYPKYLAEISFRETAKHRVCTVRDRESKDLIFEFDGRKLETKGHRKKSLTLHSYPHKDGKVLHSRVMINRLDGVTTFFKPNASFRVGKHSHSDIYRRLRMGLLLQYLYIPQGEAILFEPEELTS